MPGYGALHLADTALANVQLFWGRYPVVQTAVLTRDSACRRVFGGVAGSVGGVSAAPAPAAAAAADADPGEPALGCRPVSARPGRPSHEPTVIPMPAVRMNASASRSTGTFRSPRPRGGRRPISQSRGPPRSPGPLGSAAT